MPVADPRAGRAFVWIIACSILLSLAAGGAFLMVYMTQSDPNASSWMLYAGMALVCLPWGFWIMLCVYRGISRCLGVRIVCCTGGMDGAPSSRGGAGGGGSASMNRAGSLAGTPGISINAPSMGDTRNEDGKHVSFGGAVVVHEENGNHNGLRSTSGSFTNRDVSFKSHESEIPLASAMAS